MAKVNWFPGHMAKALNQMQEEIKKVDIILYVLDARAPFSCFNPKFDSLSINKPVLYVLNKTDLADDVITKKVYDFLIKKKNSCCVMLNSTQSGANKQIEPIMRKLCTDKLQKYSQKGLKINLRAMVVGVPNSGKSTLVNNLCGVKKAITGDKAGVTRGKQWVALKNGFELLDTPGTLWPNLENQTIAKNLAIIGSIKNEILDINDLSIVLIDYLKNNYCKSIIERYNIEFDDQFSSLEILELIAQKKHFVLKGNIIDYDRTCFMIIDDFRKGKLGKITLDTVENV